MLFLISKVVALTLVWVVRGLSTSQKPDSSLETRHIQGREYLSLTMTDCENHATDSIIKRVMFDWPRCSKVPACIMYTRFTDDCGNRRKGHRHYDSYVNGSVNRYIEKELIAQLSEN